MAGLAPSFGRGAMTNHWCDIKNTDLVLVMGGNAAEAHPVGFRWAIEAKKKGAKILVVDPRFNRTAAVADKHIPIRPGTDIAFQNGVINYLIKNNKIQREYVYGYTNASFLVNEGFNFKDGYFSGWNEEKKTYEKSTWTYQLDENGMAKQDPTLTNPRCVYRLLEAHVSRYTPEMVEKITGVSQADFQLACEWIAETSAPDKVMTNLYALGWTEHTVGSQNIRNMAIIQLLLGNIGMPGGGINALRGHANVQGITDLGIMSGSLPGYLTLPKEDQPDLQYYLKAKTPVKLASNQVNYWGNYPKFFISLLKTFYGDKATKENDFGYQWLPKWDQSYDTMNYVNMMQSGLVNGFIVQGYNLLASMPNKNTTSKALSTLKFMVVIDPMESETANFWKNYGAFNDVKPEDIDTVVFNLPSSLFAEEEGSITNSGRWLQWHWAAVNPPGEGKTDSAIVADIFLAVRKLYEEEANTLKAKAQTQALTDAEKAALARAEPLLNLAWNYSQKDHPGSDEVAKEMNGYALADVRDDAGNLILKKGQLLSSFGQLRDDGTTSSGCWIYTGCWTEAGNMMARRDNADPSGLGNTLGWSFAWPLNRRILYNRASLDRQGKPWDPETQMIWWDGSKWTGFDVADFTAAPPGSDVNPFIMQADGVGGLFAQQKLVEGPFPEHYEPVESPINTNFLHPNVRTNPAIRYQSHSKVFGTNEQYPYIGTTYRLTEHFHTLTEKVKLNAITQPQAFAEISETLAAKLGVKAGDKLKVTSIRGMSEVVAVVTKRVKKFDIGDQEVEVVGLPIHWGYMGYTHHNHMVNELTPSVGDANTQAPEFKAFLVNVEKL